MNVSSFYKTIAGSLVIGIIIITLHVLVNGTSEDAIRVVIRYTSRISALVFAVIFSISSIHKILNKQFSGFLLKHRGHLGLIFAVIHTLHLLSLVYLQNQIHPVFTMAKSSSLLAGGTAYFLMYLMALTTHPAIRKKINPKSWRLIHLIGIYWIWIIFFNTYLKKVINHNEGYAIILCLGIGLILRMASVKFPAKSNV